MIGVKGGWAAKRGFVSLYSPRCWLGQREDGEEEQEEGVRRATKTQSARPQGHAHSP